MQALEIVWIALSGVTAWASGLLILVAGVYALVLVCFGWGLWLLSGSSLFTSDYLDKSVGVAKLLGVSIVLYGAALLAEDMANEAATGYFVGPVFVGSVIYAGVPETVRVLRRRKELKQANEIETPVKADV